LIAFIVLSITRVVLHSGEARPREAGILLLFWGWAL